MTGNEYQQLALRTANEQKCDRVLNGVMGMCGEAGECIDIVKKWLFQGHDQEREKLLDEVGDVLWYCAVTLDGIDYTLEEAMEHNVEKLKKRYPNGFEVDKSINREEYRNAKS